MIYKNRENTTGLLLVLLCVLRYTIPNELFFVISVLSLAYLALTSGALLGLKVKLIAKNSYISVLFLMLCMGIFVGFLHLGSYGLTPWIRDIFYLLQPIVFLLVGACYSYKYSSTDIWKTIIIAALIMNLSYTYDIVTNLGAIASAGVNQFREIVGKEYVISTIGLCALLTSHESIQGKVKKIILIGLFTLIFFVQFSRACLGMAGVFFVVYWIAAKKQITTKSIVIALSAVVLLFVILQILPEALVSNYIEKILNSGTEISTSHGFNSYQDISRNYRGFETMRAMTTYSEGNVFDWIFGFGFGKYVELNYAIALDGEVMTRIPTFHLSLIHI